MIIKITDRKLRNLLLKFFIMGKNDYPDEAGFNEIEDKIDELRKDT